MTRWRLAPLLLGSGCSALVYQIAWERELRLVFGGSTAASAAVIAIFIAGLGAGSLYFGPRVDARARPLAYYAVLELAVAIAAALSPLTLALVRHIYISAGGASAPLRVILAALVLGPAVFPMGGTLAAAARSVPSDDRRGAFAVLYGANTIGAVAGAMLATFVLLEALGTRATLWSACALNVVVAAIAWSRSSVVAPEAQAEASSSSVAPVRFVQFACAVVGFAFFLMELVWYRMLAPLLGGSVFTFGLVLAIALLGMGLGSATYARSKKPPTLAAFATTCIGEAGALALPMLLGDRIVLLALRVKPPSDVGFGAYVFAWTLVAAVVVLPASLFAGAQFPLLIGLLGRGRERIGADVGVATASNTIGAALGAIAGGFGVLSALGAVMCWRSVVLVLASLGVLAAMRSSRRRAVGGVAVGALVLVARGPSAAWRHGQVGANRVDEGWAHDARSWRRWQHEQRRNIVWERDGVESSVALRSHNGLAFVVGGKIDGNARGDAATQVMAPLVPAMLHPDPKTALVIGLGTGSSAGWLAAVPSLDRVVVQEIEPVILDVARACELVSHGAMTNPKIDLRIGDAREALLVDRAMYDVIVSEPSNPYRAGIASLFTTEYYGAIAARLAKGGVFAQWLQAYEVDEATVRTIYATLLTTFPIIETWRMSEADLLLVASAEPLTGDVLAKRMTLEPYREALLRAWRLDDLDGFLAHRIGSPSIARAMANGASANTDDRNRVEFGFAKSVGRESDVLRLFDIRPRADARMLRRWSEGDLGSALEAWRELEREPISITENLIAAEGLAQKGDAAAEPFIDRHRPFSSIEADVLLARLRLRQDQVDVAARLLEPAFVAFRRDPWPATAVMARALALAEEIANYDHAAGDRFFEVLKEPFAVFVLDERRREARVEIARRIGSTKCVEAWQDFEPHVPWSRERLTQRRECYVSAKHPRAHEAIEDEREAARCGARAALSCW